jgi:hypothetical protein
LQFWSRPGEKVKERRQLACIAAYISRGVTVQAHTLFLHTCLRVFRFMGRAFVFQLSRQMNKKVLRLLCMHVYARVSASAAEQSGSRTSPTSHTMRVFCDSRPYAPRALRFSVRLMRVACHTAFASFSFLVRFSSFKYVQSLTPLFQIFSLGTIYANM